MLGTFRVASNSNKFVFDRESEILLFFSIAATGLIPSGFIVTASLLQNIEMFGCSAISVLRIPIISAAHWW